MFWGCGKGCGWGACTCGLGRLRVLGVRLRMWLGGPALVAREAVCSGGVAEEAAGCGWGGCRVRGCKPLTDE